MDFTLNEEQQIFREELRKFLSAEIQPADDRWGDEEMTAGRAKELCRKLVPWGYMGGSADALGFEPSATIGCIQSEELARAFPALVGISGMTAGTASGIAAGAHPEIAQRLVEPLRQSELVGCNAFTEPNAGSDPSGIECRAERRGDRWIVNGSKSWISNGHIADVAIVLVQSDPDTGPAGFRQLVIDRRESPFDSRDTPTIGLRAFPTSELYFRDVDVPEINVIGGWKRGESETDAATAVGPHSGDDRRPAGGDGPDRGWNRAARLRDRARLRQAAESVRQDDRPSPVGIGHDRRHGDRDRRLPAALLPRDAHGRPS